MKKKIIALIFIFLLCFSLPVSAYQINDYDMHHEAGMLVSLDTGDVLYSKNADARMYPASITKLMTALVMVENIPDLDNTYITYTKTANDRILGTGSVVMNLKVGEEISAKDALASLLVSSCGDVAYAIAEHVSGDIDGFVDLMNKKAEDLGLENTHFTNPVGLHSDDHYTSAKDIYVFAKLAFENELIKELSSSTRYTVSATNMSKERVLVTSNLMITRSSNVFYRYAVCGKTGYTDKSKRCLVSIASYNGYNYMSILLGAPSPRGVRYDFIDAANMFRWAFNNFEYKTLLDSGTPVTEAKVELSMDTDHVALNFEKPLKALLPKDADSSTISYKIALSKESFDAPIKKGDVLGTADIYYAEEKLGTLNLIAAESIDSSFILIVVRAAKNFLTSGFMKVVYILIGLAAVVFIGFIIKLNLKKPKGRKVKYIPLSKEELDGDE